MASGSLADTSALELFCQLTKDAATGVLDVMDGKKKRSFYLDSGDLQYTRSNLKSESAQALKAKHAGLDNRGIAALQANLRVMNAISVPEGDWTFTEDEEPPKILPLNLLSALWSALLERVDDDDLLKTLGPFLEGFPEVDFAGPYEITDLPVGPELGQLLHDLDGRRTLEEILDFAPGEDGHALRAVYLSRAVGLTKLTGSEVSTAVKVTGDVEAPDPDRPMVSISFDDDEHTDLDHTKDPAMEGISSHQVSLGTPARPKTEGPAISSLIADALGERSTSKDPEARRLQGELRRVEEAENFFEVIGVEWDATDDDYRRAYFELARRYHPDAWSDAAADQTLMVEAIIAKVNEAWETLGNPEGREAHVNSVIHGIKTEDELAMEKVSAIFAAEERFKVAQRAVASGKFTDAHGILQEIVEAVPEEHEFRANLGYTIFRINWGKDDERAQEGRDMIKTSVDAQAKMDSGWVLLGRTYAVESKYDIARKCFIKALKTNPSNPDARLEMKRIERAREEAEKKAKGFFGGLFGSKKKKKKR